MKNVVNKLGTLMINNEPKTLTVADLLRDCINAIPKEGLSVSDIQNRLRVIKVVNQVKEENATTISLEDADFKTACDCVKPMRWVIIDPFIVDFCDLFKY